jgi:hypothetical protein
MVLVEGPFERILTDVAPSSVKVSLVAQDVVVVAALPDRCARRMAVLIDSFRNAGFESSDERTQRTWLSM